MFLAASSHIFKDRTRNFYTMKACLVKKLIRSFVYAYFDKAICKIILPSKKQSSAGVWVCDFALPCFTGDSVPVLSFCPLHFMFQNKMIFTNHHSVQPTCPLQEDKSHCVVRDVQSKGQIWPKEEFFSGIRSRCHTLSFTNGSLKHSS